MFVYADDVEGASGGVESNALGVRYAERSRLKLADYYIIARGAISRHPIKAPIGPGIDLENRRRSSSCPICHKQPVMSVYPSEPPALSIGPSGRAQRLGAKGCHDIVRCPVQAIRSQVHHKDLKRIVIGEEERGTAELVSGINRDPGRFK